ncbi:MAG: twin-arginine translocase subunit TatC [Phycisphaerae bacterium]
MEQENTEKSRDREGAVKPFTEHLEDLRGVLIKSIIAVGISFAVCLYFTNDIIHIFEWPLTTLSKNSPQAQEVSKNLLRALHPADALMISLKVVMITAVILASPMIFYQIWCFILPGLKSNERRMVFPIFASGIIFFILGVLFCYFLVLRICLTFLWNFSLKMNIQPDWTIDNYISFVSMLLIAFGVVFEMPVLSAFLAKFNLITTKMLSGKRRYAYFIMAVVSALLTPPEVSSQILMIAAMIGLYELSILIVRMVEKSNNAPSS